jgi:hypothetical protein
LSNIDYVDFDTTPTTTTGAAARLRWNDTDGTLDLGLKGGNVTLQLGQEQVTLVKHADNTGLTNGKVVYTVGSDGSNQTVRYAQANSEATSSNTFGVMTEDASGGAKAFCTTFGMVHDLDTSAMTEGAIVWLSSSTAGGMTTTIPTSPAHLVQIGYCVRSHATQGVIFVKVQNGYELDELHDVLITSKTNGDLIQYESSSGLWKNKAQSTLAIAGSQVTTGASTVDTGYRLNQTLYYTTAGTATFSKASYSWLRAIKVRAVGAGGGGGGSTGAASSASNGAGGGGGGYAEKFITDIAGLTSSVTVTVGTGGSGGSAGNNAGSAGGDSSFGTAVIAKGGSGGSGMAAGGTGTAFATGGAGGVTGTGDFTVPGGSGGNGRVAAGVSIVSGYGGASQLGGSVNQPGSAQATGLVYGGGGTGGLSATTSAAGGAGAVGAVIIELYA